MRVRTHTIWEVEQYLTFFPRALHFLIIYKEIVEPVYIFVMDIFKPFNLLFFILHKCLLSLCACLAHRGAKCGFCCRSKPCFVMEIFLFTPSHKFSTLDLFPFAHGVDKIGWQSYSLPCVKKGFIHVFILLYDNCRAKVTS